MSTIRVIPSPAIGDHTKLKPAASPFLINERPSSRQLTKVITLLSPKIGQTSLDRDLQRSREGGSRSSESSFRRSKSEPLMPLTKSPCSIDNASNGKSSVSSFDHNQRGQGKLANFILVSCQRYLFILATILFRGTDARGRGAAAPPALF